MLFSFIVVQDIPQLRRDGLMYLRVARTRVEPSRIDEVRNLSADLQTALQQLPGFQTLYSGIDRSSGRGVIVSVWDTEEHAQFSREALGTVLSRSQDIGLTLEAPEIYDVLTQF